MRHTLQGARADIDLVPINRQNLACNATTCRRCHRLSSPIVFVEVWGYGGVARKNCVNRNLCRFYVTLVPAFLQLMLQTLLSRCSYSLFECNAGVKKCRQRSSSPTLFASLDIRYQKIVFGPRTGTTKLVVINNRQAIDEPAVSIPHLSSLCWCLDKCTQLRFVAVRAALTCSACTLFKVLRK